MLDVLDFIVSRDGDPEKIRQSQIKRGAPPEIVDEIIAHWETHRQIYYDAFQIGTEINKVQKEIGQRKKAKENADDLVQKKQELTDKRAAEEERAARELKDLNAKLKTVGNYIHDSVPVSTTEDDNKVLREWKPDGLPTDGTRTAEHILAHHQVLTRLGGFDQERGTKVAGHRGYCLTGYGLFLNQALINYGLEFLFNKGYTPNQPPFFMNRTQMARTAQLSEFDEELYKVIQEEDEKSEPKYLIATSEQPLSALHAEEWMPAADLPIKYAGYSTCFRKEAGKHGHDTWGTFRVHQFEKVEQFIFCDPESSWQHYDEMIAISEEFYKSLNVPHRVVSIVSSVLNNAASAKYDLEAMFPFQKEYKELVSCSNCTDYQTRELEIRFGFKKPKEVDSAETPTFLACLKPNSSMQAPGATKKSYVHALNATLCATERTLCCLLENYQTSDGLIVPEVLRKYIPGQPTFLPYTRELPKEMAARAKAGK